MRMIYYFWKDNGVYVKIALIKMGGKVHAVKDNLIITKLQDCKITKL
jgi:hypothetical protein